MFAAPSWFEPRLRGRGPPILPLYHPLLPVQGRFSGESTGYIGGWSDRPCGEMSTACHGRVSGAPPPGGGSASLRNAPLVAAFSKIHRRGLGAPGPAQGCPLWRRAPRWMRRTWAIHPAALSRLLRGVASRDQPPERLRFAPPPAAGRGLNSWGWSRLTPARRDSAAAQPVRRRWGSPSRRLGLGAEPLVFRSPVTSSGAGGAGLIHVGSRDPREPHRRPVRWGDPVRLTRFGNRVCAAGHGGEDDLDRRRQQSRSPHCRVLSLRLFRPLLS